LFRALLAFSCLMFLTSPSLQTPRQPVVQNSRFNKAGRDTIAFRYDGKRVMFKLSDFADGDPEVSQRYLEERAPLLAAPVARFFGWMLRAGNDDFWDRHRDALQEVRPGDRWIIQSGGQSDFHCTIEKFAIGEGCFPAAIAMGLILPEEQPDFLRVTAKYYLAIPEKDYISVPFIHPGPALLPSSPMPTAQQGRQLKSALQDALMRELPKMKDVDPAMVRSGKEKEWRAIDERLAKGEGTLSYDIQALRVTPDGNARWFVRARWTLDKKDAFSVSAWIRPDKNMFLVSIDAGAAGMLRTAEFQGETLGAEHQGLILNVFDYDGDGWGEVLMERSGYESSRLALYKYTDSGLVPVGIELMWGC
jgi:hypothetical protein